jgi:ankyrin repeat protein
VAARFGHLEICQILLTNLKKKNPKSNNNLTPLYFATSNNHQDIYQLLTEDTKDSHVSDFSITIPKKIFIFEGSEYSK